MIEKKCYSFSEAASILGVTRSRLHQYHKAGKLRKMDEPRYPSYMTLGQFKRLKSWHDRIVSRRAEIKELRERAEKI